MPDTPYDAFRKRLAAIPGVYSLQDFADASRKIDALQGSAREQFLGTLAGSRHVWRPILERMMWEHYAGLAQFGQDARLEDVARGGLNTIVVVLEGFEQLCTEYEELQRSKRAPEQPNDPLPETD